SGPGRAPPPRPKPRGLRPPAAPGRARGARGRRRRAPGETPGPPTGGRGGTSREESSGTSRRPSSYWRREEPMIRPVFGALAGAARSLGPASLADSREVRKSVPASAGFVVEVENLAGTMRLEGSPGGEVEVVARLHAEGSGDAETKKLLSLLDVDFEAAA